MTHMRTDVSEYWCYKSSSYEFSWLLLFDGVRRVINQNGIAQGVLLHILGKVMELSIFFRFFKFYFRVNKGFVQLTLAFDAQWFIRHSCPSRRDVSH